MKKFILIALLIVGCDDSSPTAGDSVSPLIGKVYVQSQQFCGLGCASYHFDATDNVYINYSNPQGNAVLDNGQALPEVKSFSNIEFDDDHNTFYGTIDWSSPEGTTFSGSKLWVYTMIFSDQYTRIESGTVKVYDANNNLLFTLVYGDDANELIYSLYD